MTLLYWMTCFKLAFNQALDRVNTKKRKKKKTLWQSNIGPLIHQMGFAWEHV